MTSTKILNIFFLTVCLSVISSFFLGDMIWRKDLIKTGVLAFPYPPPYYGLMHVPGTSPISDSRGALGADFSQVYFSAMAIRHGQSPYTPLASEFKDRFDRRPNYPPLTNWLYVPLTYFRYSRAVLLHNFGTLLIFFALTAYCMKRFGILRHIWKTYILYLLLYFYSPVGFSHFERGQFDFFTGSSLLLMFFSVFPGQQGPLYSVASGFFGSLKWSSFPFLGAFGTFAFLGIDNRRRWLPILALIVILLTILAFLPQIYDYLPSLQLYEFAAKVPDGVTFSYLMPKILARSFQIVCMIMVSAIFLLLCQKQNRITLFESICFPFALAMAIQGMCYGPISFEYRAVSILGLVPALALWTERTAVSPKIKLIVALSFALFFVVSFRLLDLFLGMDRVSMSIFYLISSVFWLVLCLYIILSNHVVSIAKTAIKVLVSPSHFFREMPKTEGFVKPLMFMVAMGVIDGIILGVFSMVDSQSPSDIGMGVASAVLLPFGLGILGFAGSAMLFGMWRLMGSRESYGTAYQCFSCISAVTPIIAVVGLIPYIGAAVGIAVATYFVAISSIVIHGISSYKVWPVFLIIAVICMILSISDETILRRIVSVGSSYRISPAISTFGPGPGSGTVQVTAGPNSPWTASTNPGSWDWIGISSELSGTGKGAVNYFILPNKTGRARTGTLTIAGRTFRVTQAGQ